MGYIHTKNAIDTGEKIILPRAIELIEEKQSWVKTLLYWASGLNFIAGAFVFSFGLMVPANSGGLHLVLIGLAGVIIGLAGFGLAEKKSTVKMEVY